ncbi:hypothetical protein ACE1SV_23400 [Streptomyces sp. E-15]
MSVGSDAAAVAAAAVVPGVPTHTRSASSHLSTLRMRTLPCETDVRRKLSQQPLPHQGVLTGPRPAYQARGPGPATQRLSGSAAQHRIQPELTEDPPTAPLIQTQRWPACTVTGPAWIL